MLEEIKIRYKLVYLQAQICGNDNSEIPSSQEFSLCHGRLRGRVFHSVSERLQALFGELLAQSRRTREDSPTLLFYLFAIGILLSSKSILIALQKSKDPSGVAYVLAVAGEWLLISALYVFFSRYVIEPHLNVSMRLCLSSLFCVFTIQLIPYTMCVLYASVKDKDEKIAAMKAMTRKSEISIMYKELSQDFIEFRDNNGNLRLTLNAADILYIESQDNYVNINYILDDNTESYLLRCRTRDVEELLKDREFCRCHRSYIVNPRHVRTFYSGSTRGRLVLDVQKSKEIPVSSTYFQALEQMLRPEQTAPSR